MELFFKPYTFFDLLSSIGGTLGLFLGGSIFSLFEFLLVAGFFSMSMLTLFLRTAFNIKTGWYQHQNIKKLSPPHQSRSGRSPPRIPCWGRTPGRPSDRTRTGPALGWRRLFELGYIQLKTGKHQSNLHKYGLLCIKHNTYTPINTIEGVTSIDNKCMTLRSREAKNAWKTLELERLSWLTH